MKGLCNGVLSWRSLLIAVCAASCLASLPTAFGQGSSSIFQSQKVPLKQGMLGVAVSADSPTDVWVVGTSSLHFDGTSWKQVPIASTSGVALNSVVAIAPDNVWAVGFFQDERGFDSPVVQHFDGTAWRNVRDLNLQGKTTNGQLVLGEALVSITALSATDVWAAGYLLTQNGSAELLVPFVERFDGQRWKLSGIPAASGSDVMIGVNGLAAISDQDAWLVAFQDIDGQDGQAEAFHFDGQRWKLVSSPVVGSSTLRAVAAVASNDVWAVGDKNGITSTLIEHFDGTRWTVVPSPTPSDSRTVELWGVTAISSTNVWASGFRTANSSGLNAPLILHWDGWVWSIVAAPGSGTQSSTTFGIASLAPGNVWVAGTFIGKAHQPIFEPFVLFSEQGQ